MAPSVAFSLCSLATRILAVFAPLILEGSIHTSWTSMPFPCKWVRTSKSVVFSSRRLTANCQKSRDCCGTPLRPDESPVPEVAGFLLLGFFFLFLPLGFSHSSLLFFKLTTLSAKVEGGGRTRSRGQGGGRFVDKLVRVHKALYHVFQS